MATVCYIKVLKMFFKLNFCAKVFFSRRFFVLKICNVIFKILPLSPFNCHFALSLLIVMLRFLKVNVTNFQS